MSSKEYFRNFCMRAPRPAMVRVIVGEEEHELPIEPDQSWARLGETIEALEPDRLELYDDKGQLLRADKRREPKGSNNVTIPQLLSNDPETARLSLFANLLHRAYEHSTNVAFNRMLDIVSLQSEMLSNFIARNRELEDAYLNSLQENLNLQAEGAGGAAADPLTQAFAAGMQRAQSERRQRPAAPSAGDEALPTDGTSLDEEDDGGDDGTD